MLKQSSIMILAKSDESGFSLVEAMIAIAIFALGILGAYTLQMHSTQGNTLANRVTTSTNWAAYSIEELLARHYEDDLLDDDQTSDPGNGASGLDHPLDDPDDLASYPVDGIIYVQPDGSVLYDGAGPGNPLYTVYYNVLEGDGSSENEPYAIRGIKLIRTHVFRNGGIGDGHLYTHNYYKTQWPESDQ